MFQRILLFLAGIMVVMTSGCLELPSKKTFYKDLDVEVIKYKPLLLMADGGPSSFKLIALGHSYKLSDCVDYFCDGCNGFARTPEGNTIVFLTDQQKPQAGMMTGVVHVIDFKSKSEKEVPLAIKFNGEPYRMFVKSYDGKRIVLSMNLNFSSITLEIDLDAKQVIKI